MSVQEHEPNYTDPKITAIASFSMMLGIASFFFYTLVTGIIAVVLGIIAKSKGFKGPSATVGLVTGLISLSIMGLQLYAQLAR